VFRLEKAESSVLFGNGSDTLAAVAVASPAGSGQTVMEVHFSLIGVFYLDQEVIQPYGAVKLDPSEGRLQFGNGVKGVFQTVGQDGAELRVGNGEIMRQFGIHAQPNSFTLRPVGKSRTQKVDQLIFAEALE